VIVQLTVSYNWGAGSVAENVSSIFLTSLIAALTGCR